MGTIEVPCTPLLDLQLAPSSRRIIHQLGIDILRASRTEVLNKQDTERMVQAIITECDVLPPSPGLSSGPPSGPLSGPLSGHFSNPSSNPSSSVSSRNEEKTVSAPNSSGTCKEKDLDSRKPEDDRNGGDGPGGGPKGSNRYKKSKGQRNQKAKGTGEKFTAASSSKPQEAIESLEASECSEYGYKEWEWELVDSDQEQVETTEEFGELEWTWELLDSESEIDDSDLSGESGSGFSSPIAGGPTGVAGWLQDLENDVMHSKLTGPPLATPIPNMEEALDSQTQGGP